MAGIDQLLAQMGYTPGTTAPNDDSLSGFTQGMQTFNQGAQERQQKELETKTKLFDMYKTLRSNGYDSKTAHKATLAQIGVPEPQAEESLADQETRANIGLKKSQAAYYDTGKFLGQLTENQRVSRASKKNNILNKLAYWYNTGTISDKKGDMPVENADQALQILVGDDSDIDVSDPDIQQAIERYKATPKKYNNSDSGIDWRRLSPLFSMLSAWNEKK